MPPDLYEMEDFLGELTTVFLNLPSTQRMTDEQRDITWGHLVGPRGISADLLFGLLRTTQEVGFIVPVSEHRKVKNGFMVLQIDNLFLHMVALRDGWLIDSIGARVYKYTGVIKYYSSILITSLYDLDAPRRELEPTLIEISDSEDSK
jgi:hypothetical protein